MIVISLSTNNVMLYKVLINQLFIIKVRLAFIIPHEWLINDMKIKKKRTQMQNVEAGWLTKRGTKDEKQKKRLRYTGASN